MKYLDFNGTLLILKLNIEEYRSSLLQTAAYLELKCIYFAILALEASKPAYLTWYCCAQFSSPKW